MEILKILIVKNLQNDNLDLNTYNTMKTDSLDAY